LKSTPDEQHPYYKTLYGPAPNRAVDEAASVCLLYDEVYLSPADVPLLDWQTHGTGNEYRNDDLGIYSDWKWIRDLAIRQEQAELASEDLTVSHILRRLPQQAQDQVLLNTITQLEMRDRFGADMLASPSHLRLMDRLRVVLDLPRLPDKARVARLSSALAATFELASLRFELQGVDEFQDLRQDKAVRLYAERFAKAVETLPSGADPELAILQAMSDAMDSAKVAARTKEAMSIGATAGGAISLIPIVGSIAGAAGLGADAAGRTAAALEHRKQWWTLAPEVSKVLTAARIKARLRTLGQQERL